MLEDIHPPLVAHCLRHRYERQAIYTWVGADQTVLVALNPFKPLHIYGAEQLEAAAAPAPNRIRAPHTFAIAASAYHAVRHTATNTSILISGESGAGKTEATKQCLAFLAEAAGSAEGGVEQRILQANPILEAFGNAKTVRNDNSSRFGRWMELHFYMSGAREGQVAGAFVEDYLLEKSRVTGVAARERSYHIFYQLCASPWAPALSLGSADCYPNLGADAGAPCAIDDVTDFEELLDAMTAMGFTQEDCQWAFYLVSGILHLSTVAFEPVDAGEGSVVAPASAHALAYAALYLGVDAAGLAAALIERQVAIRGEVQHMRNRVKEAREAAEALSKSLCARAVPPLPTAHPTPLWRRSPRPTARRDCPYCRRRARPRPPCAMR